MGGPARGYYPCSAIAEIVGLNVEILRKQLDRWRHDNLNGDYIEDTNRAQNEPQYYYSLASIAVVLAHLSRRVEVNYILSDEPALNDQHPFVSRWIVTPWVIPPPDRFVNSQHDLPEECND